MSIGCIVLDGNLCRKVGSRDCEVRSAGFEAAGAPVLNDLQQALGAFAGGEGRKRYNNASKGKQEMTADAGTTSPPVYGAVRAVGMLKPKFQPGTKGRIFAEALDVQGTAFWLKEYGVLVTCAHVVQHLLSAPIEVTGLLMVGNMGNYQRATIGLLDFDHDLAILRLPSDVPSEILQKEVQDGLVLATGYPEVGTEVAYSGFPLGMQLLDANHAPTYAQGVVGAQLRQKKNKKEIQITGTVVGGFSGSPVVVKNSPNQVLGVLSRSPSKEAGDADVFMAVSWEHILALAQLAVS